MREGEREKKREQQIINKIEINTHLLVKWNEKIKLGRFRQRLWERGRELKREKERERERATNDK